MRATLADRVYEGADVMDSRDVIARIEELEAEVLDPEDDGFEVRELDAEERPAGRTECSECGRAWDDEIITRYTPAPSARCPFEAYHQDEDDAAELAKLRALADEADGSPDWIYGETLIADSYVKRYAQQLAEDIGAIDRNASWPLSVIDWTAAADALKQDYMSVTYGDTEYWIRA